MKLTKESRYNKELVESLYDYSVEKGIYIDIDVADKIYCEIMELSDIHKSKALAEIPEEFSGINFNSPKQLKEVLVGYFDFEKYAGKTAKGNLSFGEESLTKIHEKTGNKFVMHLREHRSLKSIASKLQEVVDHMDDDDRVHPEYVFGETNRVSYKKPGLSNMHKSCRDVIASGEGRKLIKADYKAQEIYIQVNMLDIPELKGVFEKYDDFYTGMVKELAGVDLKPEYRDNIKLAWIAGIYNSSLKNVGETEEEIELVNLIKEKVHSIPQIEKFRSEIKRNIAYGKKNIKSYFGTERALPSWIKNPYRMQNIAFNNVFQITGSDILFFALESCNKRFKDLKLRPDDIYVYMTIHDEIIFNVNEEILDKELLDEIEDAMILDIEGWTKIKVKMEVTDTY